MVHYGNWRKGISDDDAALYKESVKRNGEVCV